MVLFANNNADQRNTILQRLTDRIQDLTQRAIALFSSPIMKKPQLMMAGVMNHVTTSVN